jgi:subtilisin
LRIDSVSGRWLRRVLLGLSLAGSAMASAGAEAAGLGAPDLDLPAVAQRGELAAALQGLRIKAEGRGRVPVIVGLRMHSEPDARLSLPQQASQRQRIAGMQAAVLGELPSAQVAQVKSFRYSPYMALSVTPAALDKLIASERVQFVSEDEKLQPSLAQSAPIVGAGSVWASGYTGSGWSVAVLDSGVQRDHPFLAGKVVREACFSTTSVVDASQTLCPDGAESQVGTGAATPCADCSHGTHVAGIAAGNGPDFSGVARGAALIAVQVFSRFTGEEQCGTGVSSCLMSWTSDVLLGLEHVYSLRGQLNIAAVNLSLGSGLYLTYCDADPLKPAVDSLRAAGIATVVASGNEGYAGALSNPACISSTVSVGATYDVAGFSNQSNGWDGGTSSVDEVASFSNSSTMLDLLAPGALITSSVPGSAYATYMGTSMAAPHVAGCWAALKQAKPAAGVTEIELAIMNTGLPVVDWRNGLIKPRLDCKAALDRLNGVVSPPDLYPSTFGIDPATVATGSSVNLYASVRNMGGTASPATTLRYLRSNDANITLADSVLCTDAIPALAAGAVSPAQSCIVTAPATAGTYYHGVCVDVVSGENQTANNCSESQALSVVSSNLPDLVVTQVAADAQATLGSSLNLSATVINQSQVAAASRLDISLISVDTFAEVPFAYCDVPALGMSQSYSCGGSILLPMNMQAGSYTVVARADSEGAVAESNEANNTLHSATTTLIFSPAPDPALAEAVDAGALSWVSGGHAKWFSQTAVSVNGGDAARSGAVGHNQYSELQTTVTGPGVLAFQWKVSSEENHDYLALFMDDVLVDRISGEVDWTRRSVSIPSGSHRLAWTYVKDDSINAGQDAAWLDQVEMTAGSGDLASRIEQWRNARQKFLPVR